LFLFQRRIWLQIVVAGLSPKKSDALGKFHKEISKKDSNPINFRMMKKECLYSNIKA